jgi:two-component system, LytTR family, response regulator
LTYPADLGIFAYMKKYSAIIIDDERYLREAMEQMLVRHCPEIAVLGSAASAEEGRELLKTHQVDIIFLDISMPKEDGFAFLGTIQKENYAIIFVTAYQEYALRALKASAIDYLLKPVNLTELREAVSKAIKYHEFRQSREEVKKIYHESLDVLHENIQSGNRPITKITVAGQFGFQLVNVSDIMYMEADSNYTIMHLSSLTKIVATRTMGDFEKIINSSEFFRIHKSTIINMNFLKGYYSYQGDFAELTDGTRLSIARRKMNEFLEVVSRFAK